MPIPRRVTSLSSLLLPPLLSQEDDLPPQKPIYDDRGELHFGQKEWRGAMRMEQKFYKDLLNKDPLTQKKLLSVPLSQIG